MELSADHIGPISLGFCHRPKFHPMQMNSIGKKNRMTFADVKILLEDEKNGDHVISWHSKYLWDSLKNRVTNYADAVRFSSLMRKNLHYVLTLFSKIDDTGSVIFKRSF